MSLKSITRIGFLILFINGTVSLANAQQPSIMYHNYNSLVSDTTSHPWKITVAYYSETDYQKKNGKVVQIKQYTQGKLVYEKRISSYSSSQSFFDYDTTGKLIKQRIAYSVDKKIKPDSSIITYIYSANKIVGVKYKRDTREESSKFEFDSLGRILSQSFYQNEKITGKPELRNKLTFIYYNDSSVSRHTSVYEISINDVIKIDTLQNTIYDKLNRIEYSGNVLDDSIPFFYRTTYDKNGRIVSQIMFDGSQMEGFASEMTTTKYLSEKGKYGTLYKIERSEYFGNKKNPENYYVEYYHSDSFTE